MRKCVEYLTAAIPATKMPTPDARYNGQEESEDMAPRGFWRQTRRVVEITSYTTICFCADIRVKVDFVGMKIRTKLGIGLPQG